MNSKRKSIVAVSSIPKCQEKHSCGSDKSDAVIECEDCGSKQCYLCNNAIHNKERNHHHERKKLTATDPLLLCQNNCSSKNFANLLCMDCKNTRYCITCFDATHPFGSLKRNHNTQKYKRNLICKDDSKVDADLPTPAPDVECFQLDLTEDEEDFKTCHFDVNSRNHASAFPRDQNGMPNFAVDIAATAQDFAATTIDAIEKNPETTTHSFHLLDSEEKIMVKDKDDFLRNLKCEESSMLKVVSIFGNTGDGKSHTLNEIFFNGSQVFETSTKQYSCTAGAWAALDRQGKTLVVDTEGLLGISKASSERTRLLLKVLAISDVVIYRTRAERIHQDMLTFLHDSAKAYSQYFHKELEAANSRGHLNTTLTKLGPAVVIFHETQHTNTLEHDQDRTGASLVRDMFTRADMSIDGFNSIHYIGTKTGQKRTNFRDLKARVEEVLNDRSVRSPRRAEVIFHALEVLNNKFSGKIEDSRESFPDQYFTCNVKCLSCNARCANAMNHVGVKHQAAPNMRCKYQHQYENKVYLCKKCNDSGDSVMVVPKAFSSKESSVFGMASYAWSGFVLECKNCGVIYRSRQYWYGNEEPDRTSVRTEIEHVWEGSPKVLQGTHNAARRFIDGLGYVSDSIASVSSKPARAVSLWVTDKIAPPYWRPNSEITKCMDCEAAFNSDVTIHHCRRCGEGFCDDCSSHRCPVPERGWGLEPVRVCNQCSARSPQETISTDSLSSDEASQIRSRQLGEVLGSTVGAVASVVTYPLGVLKESSRPTYWTSDADITECVVCKKEFGIKLKIHHCRACGQGVCHACSSNKCEVPTRGWDDPVRVCDQCVASKHIL